MEIGKIWGRGREGGTRRTVNVGGLQCSTMADNVHKFSKGVQRQHAQRKMVNTIPFTNGHITGHPQRQWVNPFTTCFFLGGGSISPTGLQTTPLPDDASDHLQKKSHRWALLTPICPWATTTCKREPNNQFVDRLCKSAHFTLRSERMGSELVAHCQLKACQLFPSLMTM